MKRKKYKQSRLDWFTVSYSTIIFWLVVATVIIVGSLILYYIYFKDTPSEQKAEIEIAKAEQLIAEIENLRPNESSLVDEAKKPLAEAKRYKQERIFEEAIRLAKESQRFAQDRLERIQGKKGEHKAYLTSIEGGIQVKRKGAVDWIDGKEGMELSSGDLVKTTSNSTSNIMFFDHTSYTLRANTLIAINESFEDPFSRARKVSVKLDFGEVDLTTGKKNVPGSSSAISSPTTKTVMGEESSGVVSYNPNTASTSFSLYQGTANLDTGKRRIQVKPLEKINVNKNEEISSKTNIAPPPILIRPADERQFILENPEEAKINFVWQKSNGAENYTLEISRTSLFGNPLLTRKGITKNRLELNGFGEGIYYWHVSASSQGKGESKFSKFRKFRIRKIRTGFASEDITPPKLEIAELKVLGNIILLFGTTEPDVLLTLNNNKIDVENDGTFRDVIELHQLGKNILKLIAQDPSGNKTEVKREVYIEEY